MTTAKKANQRAEKLHSGQGTTSNAGGTAAGPGSSSAPETKTEAQRSIAGAGSPKTAGNRPGHKTHS